MLFLSWRTGSAVNAQRRLLSCRMQMLSACCSVLLILFCLEQVEALPAQRPNIVLIIADDLGFNDVSFRGSNQIPTPNIDALAFSGMILDRHYVMPTCTPSRTALLTGLYPIRTGMQGFPLYGGEPRGLPLELSTLPDHLRKLGYRTNLVGKWHLGFHKSAYLPTRRGFDHHLGYWNGLISYFNHSVSGGFDMHRDEEIAWDLQGRYATHLFTEEAEKIIAQHDTAAGAPLFLELAHLAPHTGGINGTDVEVPDEAENDRRYSYIQEKQRRLMAGAMWELDLSVGRVVQALQDRSILNNTIIVFMADNGGESLGKYRNGGSNWPLRGQKSTVYEGGVRGVAAVWSPFLARPSSVHQGFFHETDWLPTFYEAAGGDVANLGVIDGRSQWSALTSGSTSTRSEMLVQINEAGALIQDTWKLIKGNQRPHQSQYLGESGRGDNGEVPAYDAEAIASSATAAALAAASGTPPPSSAAIRSLRAQATLPASCRPSSANPGVAPAAPDTACDPYCLFDILADPCESKDVSAAHREVGDALLERMRYWETQTRPKLNAPVDPASDPARHGMAWVPWLDQEEASSASLPRHQDVIVFLAVTLIAYALVERRTSPLRWLSTL